MDIIATLIILVGLGLVSIFTAFEWVLENPLMFVCYILLAASILFFLLWAFVYFGSKDDKDA